MKSTGYVLLLLAGIATASVSCSAPRYNQAYRSESRDYRYGSVTGSLENQSESGFAKGNQGSGNEMAPRRIVYNANVAITVKDPDTTNIHLNEIAIKYGGYTQQISRTMTRIRVKAENLNSALSDICLLGKTEYKRVQGIDVTDDYTDYAIRLENLTKARARYLELLAKAENVEAALLVEKELERLNTEIDLIKGKLNNLDHNLVYSLITVDIKEKVKPGILGYIGIGLYHSIKWLFVRN
ncbi:MAG TPA: DUF4349 domain-containing protein [Bacteroidales bacterium]|nr:DUF4349 domain-containing protein [Bacteroidales bacterium]HRZ47795.1 DUF4349 domain-containing protein [Bacteroidales bacterium]